MKTETITIKEIQEVLESVLPEYFIIKVSDYKLFGEYTGIQFYPTEYLINGVSGQYPGVVSLSLEKETGVLSPQVFGGSGGRSVYREIDPSKPEEKYNALGREIIPFRKPKTNKKAILSCIERFATRYLETMQDIKERGLLRHEEVYTSTNFIK